MLKGSVSEDGKVELPLVLEEKGVDRESKCHWRNVPYYNDSSHREAPSVLPLFPSKRKIACLAARYLYRPISGQAGLLQGDERCHVA
jgi:hypothetical protein